MTRWSDGEFVHWLIDAPRMQDLANHAASLNSTRGAAFGFASIAKLAGEQLQPYVDKMVPKLYRRAHLNINAFRC